MNSSTLKFACQLLLTNEAWLEFFVRIKLQLKVRPEKSIEQIFMTDMDGVFLY